MNRISLAFQNLQKNNLKAIIPYITPEFPMKGVTVPLILGLVETGASIVELGIPFSDPLADGPTIQQSSDVAIKNGVNINKVFEIVSEARMKSQISIVLMGYFNPILHYGVSKFLKDAHTAGVDGLIIPDLPPEESNEFCTEAKQNSLSTIFLIAPTSSDARIRHIDSISSDFLYCVSVTGVTGERNTFGNQFDEFLKRVRKNTTKPFVVGFGIKKKEQVDSITKYSDGVVIGSALIHSIAEKKTVDDVVSTAKQFLQSLQYNG